MVPPMRAYQINEGFGLENLRLAERDEPLPGPGQVRVRVRAVSLNYRDLLMVRGHYNPRQPLPLIPLSDGVGEIDAVGDRVERWAVGDRVASLFAQRWPSGDPDKRALASTLGGPLDGMLAEQVVLEEDGVIAVPEHLSHPEAATLPCAALTAWSALVTHGRIRAGDTVLIQGTGGVSSFALAFAKMHGARVINTTSRMENQAALIDRGAWQVIDYTEHKQWGKVARELTGGAGVDHVVEVGGAPTIDQSLKAVRPGGVISLIGVLAGGVAKVNLTPALMNNVRIQGIFVGHASSFAAMNQAIAQHELRPAVDRVFAFDQAVAAFEYMGSAKHVGKICIEV